MTAEQSRQDMIDRQLRPRGIRDARLLAAMGRIPREVFVPPDLAGRAYEDGPLPIGHGQTISQPYIVAAMLAAAAPGPTDVVLDVGTGSGYAAAVAAALARRVVSIERIPELAEAAGACLARLGIANVEVHVGDGTGEPPGTEVFDVVLVAAAAPDVPPALLRRLAPGGRLVAPVGHDRGVQDLVRLTRLADGSLGREELERVAFVPLIGAAGWPEPTRS